MEVFLTVLFMLKEGVGFVWGKGALGRRKWETYMFIISQHSYYVEIVFIRSFLSGIELCAFQQALGDTVPGLTE